MTDLLKEIQDSLGAFNSRLTEYQSKLYQKIMLLVKDLDLYADGSIKNSLKNIQAIGSIKNELQNLLLDKPYVKSVADLLGSYTTIVKIQNDYFSSLTTEFSPKKVFDVVKTQAVEQAAEALTEAGINANVIAPIRNIISINVKSGGSYSDLADILRTTVTGDTEADGILLKYADTYAVDAVNTFAAQYGQMISDDLGLVYYQFTGSMVKTSRPMCMAMHEKRYFHRSQFPDLVQGIVYGKQTPLGKNGLPLGMKEGTTPDNYQTLRNGWKCGHLLQPVSAATVPDDVRRLFE